MPKPKSCVPAEFAFLFSCRPVSIIFRGRCWVSFRREMFEPHSQLCLLGIKQMKFLFKAHFSLKPSSLLSLCDLHSTVGWSFVSSYSSLQLLSVSQGSALHFIFIFYLSSSPNPLALKMPSSVLSVRRARTNHFVRQHWKLQQSGALFKPHKCFASSTKSSQSSSRSNWLEIHPSALIWEVQVLFIA